MPRKFRSKRRSKKPKDSKMQELLLLQRQQIVHGTPNAADVVFPRMKQHVYSVVTNGFAFSITSSTTAVSTGAYFFSLNQLPLYTSFTALFDRYRILHIQLQFNPQVSAPTGGGPLITAFDYDDAAVVTSEIQQRDTAMVTPVPSYFERTFTPRIASAVYAGTFSGFANSSSRIWIDSASSNVQYYGLKYYLPIQTSAATVYSVSVRIHAQFKNNF